MDIRPLTLKGAHEITLVPHGDERGYFARTYDQYVFEGARLHTDWVQESESLSLKKGTVRGLHYQRPPYAETKLVRVVRGAVLDVVVDLRRHSETFGLWEAVELSPERHNLIYVPKGFAHGFCTLMDDTLVLYKMDAPYVLDSQAGLRWDDPTLAIAWPVTAPCLSVRDTELPLWTDFETPF